MPFQTSRGAADDLQRLVADALPFAWPHSISRSVKNGLIP